MLKGQVDSGHKWAEFMGVGGAFSWESEKLRKDALGRPLESGVLNSCPTKISKFYSFACTQKQNSHHSMIQNPLKRN